MSWLQIHVAARVSFFISALSPNESPVSISFAFLNNHNLSFELLRGLIILAIIKWILVSCHLIFISNCCIIDFLFSSVYYIPNFYSSSSITALVLFPSGIFAQKISLKYVTIKAKIPTGVVASVSSSTGVG